MPAFDVVGFGALNVDKLFKVNRIAEADEESFVQSHAENCGGSAANTMVGLARLGCKAGFIGKVAGDREGALLLEDFQKEAVDSSGIIRADHGHSGQVIGFVGEEGERALYIESGVNDTIRLHEVSAKYVSQSRFLHLTSFVGEESFQTQKQLVDLLPETRVSFDPGALYARKGFEGLEHLIRRAHVMIPNANELKLISGEEDYCKGADFLVGVGVKVVAVKLGADGCYVTDGRERLVIEAFPVKAVDTTGAGDAFDAGFLFGLLNSKPLNECGRLGNFVASRCVMKIGARTGLPYLKDLSLVR